MAGHNQLQEGPGPFNALGRHSYSKFVKSDKGLRITPKITLSMKDERDKHVISLNISTQTKQTGDWREQSHLSVIVITPNCLN